jgi:CBS domain containing-hemolysin-like protein
MRPLTKREEPAPSFLEGFLRRLRELTWLGENENGNLRETLEELIEEAEHEAGATFSEQERALVRNALSFGELRVGDVMVPRVDVKGVEASAGIADVVKAIRQAQHSRLLVYRDTLDEVLGIVHIKDLLPFWGDGESFSLEAVTRPVLVVPPSMRVIDLLLEMRATRNHVAIVVDEFGGTDGLVTLEDLVEEIVGEMQDERDRTLQPTLVANPDGSLDVSGRTDLDELETRLGVRLLEEDERDEAETLGGLIFNLVDRVPGRGDVVQHPSGIEFEVLEADPRRIKRVRIRMPAPPAGETSASGD